ncbi:LOW QUALITY PROTEIN: hypothetical protein ACHAWO_001674 [Cyclotella atomus]|uniref:Nucleotide-sugar transporter n=1 Tax=Cyclotella atomus TaxID=382360 RepID=A0ABD3Q0A3_9STRA
MWPSHQPNNLAAFATPIHHHSNIKWACKTSPCITSFRPPSIHATRSLALQVHQSPLSIIGGAAAKIAAANTDTLSTAALTTMFLLALQYCAQPPLTRKFLDSRANKKGITMVEEVVKIGLSAAFFLSCGKDVVASELHGWTLSSSLLLAGLPAILYATQGVLTYLGYQNTDSVTFNGLNQTKTLSAAMWCFLLMGKRQSAVQMVALTILLFSALLFQGSISFAGLFQKKADAHIIHTDTHDIEDSRFQRAYYLVSVLLSFRGALSQKGVQLAGGKGRNAYLYTMELGTYSSISLLVSMFATKNGRASLGGEGGIFKHWTPFSIIPITVRAMGGILTALVHKYAGATRKGFALILGLVMTGVMQSVIERERPSMDEMLAMALVILSSYLHLAFPPMA